MSCENQNITGPLSDGNSQTPDPVLIYRLTLEAILAAQRQLLCPCPPQVGLPETGCRIPSSCPVGFQGRYTVRTGDTMFLIAQRCGVSLQALINANPHISNPSQIFPCDVLCVPLQCASSIGEVPLSCCSGQSSAQAADAPDTPES